MLEMFTVLKASGKIRGMAKTNEPQNKKCVKPGKCKNVRLANSLEDVLCFKARAMLKMVSMLKVSGKIKAY